MTDSQLDEIFKKQLPGHESPVPEDMWERIIRKKDKDRKGFFFFFSLIGLFLLGFGVAGILLFNKNDKRTARDKDHINKSKAISNPDPVMSAGTDQHMKVNPSVNQEAAFGGTDSVLNTAGHKHQVTGRITQHSTSEILLKQSGFKNKYSNTEQERSTGDATASTVENDGSIDSIKKSDDKVNPVLSSTPKPVPADSAKATTSKKLDSTKKDIGNKWSLDLYASPDYPIEYAKYYVKSKLSYTVGLRLNRSFGKRFSGKIGIQFSQLNYDLPDTSGYPGAYHLMRLDLPVLAGYSWGNETFGMTVNAGVIFNLYSWLHQDSTSYIKSNAGLSLYLGINFSKHINDRMELFSEPYYRYQLSSSTVSTFYFQKFIDVAGVSFGVRYHFKK
jgi:hypothetical protein